MPDPTVAYFRGKFVPLDQATVSVRCKALNYGLGVFEGIRGYWNASHNQLYVFRLREHFERLRKSCLICRLPLSHTVDELIEITCELLRRNEHREDVYVRPLVYVATELLAPALPTDPAEVDTTLWTLPLRNYFHGQALTAHVTSWRRVSDNMIPARAKPTGAYLNSALARAEAHEAKCDEAIFLTNDGYVSEGSAEHLFLVLDGKLVTSTAQDDNLDGITRRTILEIAAKELGIETVARRVSRTELYIADEAFFCGTGAEVVPVVSIDHRAVGNGEQGPVTTAICELYRRVVHNEVPKYSAWCHPVYK
ncbi:MAG TPA: branched-chain amino acid transaminase [Candidatus Brocadiia bacterium]|nr:branched-chain amino acid transaminase [Candidatus Brocadiia bacterium]